MKFWKWLWVVPLVVIGVVCWTLIGVAWIEPSDAEDQTPPPAQAYEPNCGDDTSCHIWAEFRAQHPFPHQTFAVKSTDDGFVLIISEPAPVLSRGQFKEFVTTAFGDDLRSYQEHRWMIGVDGWLEDVVLAVRSASASKTDNVLDDPLTSDRLALLHQLLYGTTYGARVENIGQQYETLRDPRRPISKFARPN